MAENKLFKLGYYYKHYILPACIYSNYYRRINLVYTRALILAYNNLGCNKKYLVKRN